MKSSRMREGAKLFAAVLAATLAVGGALIAGGAGRFAEERLSSSDAREEAWRARAIEAGRVAAAKAAEEACAGLETERLSLAEARRRALCQLHRAPAARTKEGAATLTGLAKKEARRKDDFLARAMEAYESSEPFDSTEGALAPIKALTHWQQAVLKAGKPMPREATEAADAATLRLSEAVGEELRAAMKADGSDWVFKIAPGSVERVRASALTALSAQWRALYPESLKGAEEMLAQGEEAGMRAMNARSEKWAQEKLKEIESAARRSIEAEGAAAGKAR